MCQFEDYLGLCCKFESVLMCGFGENKSQSFSQFLYIGMPFQHKEIDNTINLIFSKITYRNCIKF